MLKPTILSAALVSLIGASPVAADGVLSLGVTFAFGGGTAASVGVWSNDESGEGAVGVTANYYFQTNQVGVSANVGIVQDDFIGSVGYDFMQQAPTIGLHVIDGASDEAPGEEPEEVEQESPIQIIQIGSDIDAN